MERAAARSKRKTAQTRQGRGTGRHGVPRADARLCRRIPVLGPDSRANELLAYGVPAQRSRRARAGAAPDRDEAYQRGVSAAETLYHVAQQRGFRAKAARRRNGNGAAEQIQRVATGQQRSQSLSGTGGGAAPTKMTAEQLLSMSNEEFAAWTEKNPAARRG